jgi:hypothetical protein
MELRTLKFLEFAAIFGVIAWYWFSQRSASSTPKDADQPEEMAAAEPDDATGKDANPPT